MAVIPELIARQLSLSSVGQAEHTIRLLDDGCTVPFISRYRKEATGGLDEVAVERIRDLYAKYTDLEKRKTTVLQTIDEQGKLTAELREAIEGCWDGAVLEDLYLPYKPKRRTRGMMARERGLEPLAATLMRQAEDPERLAGRFVRGEEVPDVAAALAGAADIVAEWVGEQRPESGCGGLSLRAGGSVPSEREGSMRRRKRRSSMRTISIGTSRCDTVPAIG